MHCKTATDVSSLVMDANHIGVLVVIASDEGSSRKVPYAARKSSFSTFPSVNCSVSFQTYSGGLDFERCRVSMKRKGGCPVRHMMVVLLQFVNPQTVAVSPTLVFCAAKGEYASREFVQEKDSRSNESTVPTIIDAACSS